MEEKKKVKKNNKPKFSFYLVSFLLVFCIVGSLLGTIVFFQNNFGTKRVKADEPTEIIEYDNLFNNILTGSSFEEFTYQFYENSYHISCSSTSFDSYSYLHFGKFISLGSSTFTVYFNNFSALYGYNCISVVGHNYIEDHSTWLVDIYDSTFYTLQLTQSFDYIEFVYLCKGGERTVDFSAFVWSGSWNLMNITDSMKYQIGYSQGVLDTYSRAFNDGYSEGQLNYASSYYVKQSFAMQKATYRVYGKKSDGSSDHVFGSFLVGGGVARFNNLDFFESELLEDGFIPYYIHIEFNSSYPLILTSNSDLGLFNVSNRLPLGFYMSDIDVSVGPLITFNNSISASGGSNWDLIIGHNIQSIDIYYDWTYTSASVVPTRSTISNINDDSYFIFDLYNASNNSLYSNGYDNGYNVGYNVGYVKGTSESGNYSFNALLGAVIDAPITALSGLLNFEILGVNLLNFFFGILTLAIIIFVIRLFL